MQISAKTEPSKSIQGLLLCQRPAFHFRLSVDSFTNLLPAFSHRGFSVVPLLVLQRPSASILNTKSRVRLAYREWYCYYVLESDFNEGFGFSFGFGCFDRALLFPDLIHQVSVLHC